MAISVGLSLDDIKILVRWKSDAAKLYLTEKSLNTINFAINKRLHQHSIIHLALPRQESSLISRPANAGPFFSCLGFPGHLERSPGFFPGPYEAQVGHVYVHSLLVLPPSAPVVISRI